MLCYRLVSSFLLQIPKIWVLYMWEEITLCRKAVKHRSFPISLQGSFMSRKILPFLKVFFPVVLPGIVFNVVSTNAFRFGATTAWKNKIDLKNNLFPIYVPISRVILYSIVIRRWPYKLLSSDSCYSIDFRSYTSFQAESAARNILGSGGNREKKYSVLSILVSWETWLWESTFQQNILKLLQWTWAEAATGVHVSLPLWEMEVLRLSAESMTRIKSLVCSELGGRLSIITSTWLCFTMRFMVMWHYIIRINIIHSLSFLQSIWKHFL